MPLHHFKGKSYKTFSGAVAKLSANVGAIGKATSFVACQPSPDPERVSITLYYPVVIYRDDAPCNVGVLIHNGVTVIN